MNGHVGKLIETKERKWKWTRTNPEKVESFTTLYWSPEKGQTTLLTVLPLYSSLPKDQTTLLATPLFVGTSHYIIQLDWTEPRFPLQWLLEHKEVMESWMTWPFWSPSPWLNLESMSIKPFEENFVFDDIVCSEQKHDRNAWQTLMHWANNMVQPGVRIKHSKEQILQEGLLELR